MPHPHAHTPGRHPAPGAPGMPRPDFDQAPFVVIWETTQACDLACVHCRAEAQPQRDAGELTTAEARQMMTDVRRFGPVVFVFSGGDCLKRPDIVELVAHGTALGMRMAITPATTPLCSRETMTALREAGLVRLAVSLDGSNPAVHDSFRKVDGSFEHGLRILREAQEIGLSTQVNTVIRKDNLADMDAMCALMETLGVVFWEVFFLVPMGRAKPDDVAGADDFEQVMDRLYELSRTAPFDIKATAAPQYARVVMQHKRAEQESMPTLPNSGPLQRIDVLTSGAHHSLKDGIGRARNVNDGDGFLFVSHTGELFPSGFLPISGGNVRTDDLVEVYRTSPVFTALRDRSRLKGKCGVCNYRSFCGGSRARAYAVTGDPLESEPFCAYVPPRWQAAIADGWGADDATYFAERSVTHRSPLPIV